MKSKVLLSAAAALLLLGCSSVPTQVDKGPIRAGTFSFMPLKRMSVGDMTAEREKAHAEIQAAITENLKGRGLQRVDQGGQVTVAYLVVIGNNAATAAYNDYFGYGQDAAKLAAKVHENQAIKGTQRRYYETGTLVIDFLDPQTSKLLWRSSVQDEILRNAPTQAERAKIRSLVNSALQNLRVRT